MEECDSLSLGERDRVSAVPLSLGGARGRSGANRQISVVRAPQAYVHEERPAASARATGKPIAYTSDARIHLRRMKLRFTKMQGAGNDFVMLDGVRQKVDLSRDQVRRIADRRFGVGADQVLLVEPPMSDGVDFRYRIFNADGGEVEQCGNGARCFVRFVRDQQLTDKSSIRVETLSGVIEPRLAASGEVSVDMGLPMFELARVPFDLYWPCVAPRP